MSAQHTPGPWKACCSAGGDFLGIYPDTGAAEFPVAKMPGIIRPGVNEANARLIAAAPELLAALKEAVDLIVQVTQSRWSEWEATEAETVGDFRAAIAKATGGQP